MYIYTLSQQSILAFLLIPSIHHYIPRFYIYILQIMGEVVSNNTASNIMWLGIKDNTPTLTGTQTCDWYSLQAVRKQLFLVSSCGQSIDFDVMGLHVSFSSVDMQLIYYCKLISLMLYRILLELLYIYRFCSDLQLIFNYVFYKLFKVVDNDTFIASSNPHLSGLCPS